MVKVESQNERHKRVIEMNNFGNLKKLKETLNGEKYAEKVNKNFKIGFIWYPM
jgi:hypothetical protein